MAERIILHCDLDNFFASVECVFRPELRDVPMAVCGSESDRHGIVLAKNQLAKKAGVKTAQTVWQARSLCPQLVCVEPHMDKYREFSARARQIYLRYTDLVEPFSIDECWLDVTGSTLLFGSGEEIAKRISDDMRRELGITVSVGVSFCKFFSKLASEINKPNGIYCVGRNDFKEKLYPRPVTELLGVGGSTKEKLFSVGIFTIGDLAAASPELVRKLLGKPGDQLLRAVSGLECEPVRRYGDIPAPKSIGRSVTLPEDVSDIMRVRSIFAELADDISSKLRREGMLACTVQIQIKDRNFKISQYQRRLENPTRIADELLSAAVGLLSANDALRVPARLVGLTACDLVGEEGGMQLSFGFDQRRADNLETLGSKVDLLRDKYGKQIIKRASQLENNNDK